MKIFYSLKNVFLLCLFCMIGSVSAWGQDLLTPSNLGLKGYDTHTATVEGVDYTCIQLMRQDNGIQFKNNKGALFTTSTKGIAKSISFTSWSAGVSISIYGSHTAFKSRANVEKGVLLAQINKGDVKDYSLTTKGKFEYLGIVNNSRYANVSSISITWEQSGGSTPETVAAPQFNLEPSVTYTEPQVLKITAEAGAEIRYTFGAETPTASSTLYDEAKGIELTQTTTVNAIALKSGVQSDVTSATFNFKTVTPPTPTEGYTYVKVTDASGLVAGDTYLIVEENKQIAMSSADPDFRHLANVTVSNGMIVLQASEIAQQASDEGVYELVLGGSKDAWSLKDVVNQKYLCAGTSKKNYIKMTETEADAYATITFDANQNTDIKFNSRKDRNWIRYNSGDPRFSCYTSGQNPIQLYRKVSAASTTGKFTISAAGYATFYTENAFEMPQGVEGGIVSDVLNQKLTIDYNYQPGQVVPAKTPLLLKGAADTYTYNITTSTEAAPVENMLCGATADGLFTADADHYYYKLAYDNFTEKTGFGFYWGAPDGGAFKVKKGLAYLAIPTAKAAEIKGFSFDGTVSGLEEVENAQQTKVAYTLDGRRVNADQLSKGLYIINGKKVIIK